MKSYNYLFLPKIYSGLYKEPQNEKNKAKNLKSLFIFFYLYVIKIIIKNKFTTKKLYLFICVLIKKRV
jgi:hypothetical protein